jgi:hypothetical protein
MTIVNSCRRSPLAVFFVVLWSLVAIPDAAIASADRDAAAAMIKELHLGNNLRLLVLTAASKTETFHMILAHTGPVQGPQLIQSHIDAVLPKYQGQWDANLAAAYAEHFTAKEMTSLVKDKQASPYMSALRDRQHDVGTSMQRISSDLLIKITTEVLAGAYADVPVTK